MSYTTTYTCDRCTRTIAETGTRHEIRHERLISGLNNGTFSEVNHYDLCDPCGDELRKFIGVI